MRAREIRETVIQSRHERHRAALRTPVGDSYVTVRERQAINLYALGGTPTSVALIMCVDYRTVDGLMRNARMRTGARTNCQLVAMYIMRHKVVGRARGKTPRSDPRGAPVGKLS